MFRRLALYGACTLLLLGCATPRASDPLLRFDMGGSPGTKVAFSREADRLAGAAVNGNVYLWHLPDGRMLATWRAHRDSIHGLAFLKDGRLVSASYDQTLALWSIAGKLIARAEADAPMTAMVVDETSGTVWTGHADGSVRAWQVDTLAALARLPRHRGEVHALAYHAASGTLASSGADGKIYVGGRTESGRALMQSPTLARDLVFNEAGRTLIGSGWFKLFRWDVDSGALTVLPTAHQGMIASLDRVPGSSALASISRNTDSSVRLLDPRTGETVRYLATHDLCGAQVRVSPGGRYLASVSDDASVWVFALK